MREVPISEAKNSLSTLVDEVEAEHEIIRLTRHGRGAAVLISEDDLESLRETVFWSSQSGIHEDIAAARSEAARGATLSADEVRTRLRPPTSRP